MAGIVHYESRTTDTDFSNDSIAILQMSLCNSTLCNGTFMKNFSREPINRTLVVFEAKYGMWHVATTSVLLGVFILCTIIGNVFVVAAIILEKNLQSVSNYLILSLAVADLMVATLVMPISALQELSKKWWLGIELCDIWLCFDVLCCTASILHLVAIAIDRYWAVTNVDYIRRRTAKRIITMIVLVWTISIVISIPARFHIGRAEQFEKVQLEGECLINQELGFTVFSTVGAFYFPMLFMLVLYMRIYQTARARIRKKQFQKKSRTSSSAPSTAATAPKTSTTNFSSPKPSRKADKRQQSSSSNSPELSLVTRGEPAEENTANNNHTMDRTTSFTADGEIATAKQNGKMVSLLTPKPKRKIGRQEKSAAETQRERLEHKRERKAARTLAIITGCFLLCWLPFFIHATVMPFCGMNCPELPPVLLSFFLWLGYLNSLLNPVIYTIFSPDFRNAFRKILFGRYYKGGGRR